VAQSLDGGVITRWLEGRRLGVFRYMNISMHKCHTSHERFVSVFILACLAEGSPWVLLGCRLGAG